MSIPRGERKVSIHVAQHTNAQTWGFSKKSARLKGRQTQKQHHIVHSILPCKVSNTDILKGHLSSVSGTQEDGTKLPWGRQGQTWALFPLTVGWCVRSSRGGTTDPGKVQFFEKLQMCAEVCHLEDFVGFHHIPQCKRKEFYYTAHLPSYLKSPREVFPKNTQVWFAAFRKCRCSSVLWYHQDHPICTIGVGNSPFKSNSPLTKCEEWGFAHFKARGQAVTHVRVSRESGSFQNLGESTSAGCEIYGDRTYPELARLPFPAAINSSHPIWMELQSCTQPERKM